MPSSPEYGQFLDGLPGNLAVTPYGRVREGLEDYTLVRLDNQLWGRPRVLITTGIHGDEAGGPLSILSHGQYIADYAAACGVGLTIYPCINPSGIVHEERYNLSGEKNNNDLFHYVLPDGTERGEVTHTEVKTARIAWGKHHAKEMRLLLEDLEKLPAKPVAMLDIHQDGMIPRKGKTWYAYIFERTKSFIKIAARASRVLPAYVGGMVRTTDTGPGLPIDQYGFAITHDGTLTDLCYHQGVPNVVCLETGIDAPYDKVAEITSIWACGLIDLAASWSMK
jgi:predicted deacylase